MKKKYVFYKTELYLMDPDGRNKVRLTYFNEPKGEWHLVGESSMISQLKNTRPANFIV